MGISYGVKDSLVGILSIRHLYLGGKNEPLTDTDTVSKATGQQDKRSSNSYLSNKTSQQHKKQDNAKTNIINCCLLNGGLFLVSGLATMILTRSLTVTDSYYATCY